LVTAIGSPRQELRAGKAPYGKIIILADAIPTQPYRDVLSRSLPALPQSSPTATCFSRNRLYRIESARTFWRSTTRT